MTANPCSSPVAISDERELFWSRTTRESTFLPRRVDEPIYDLTATDIYSVSSAAWKPRKTRHCFPWNYDLVPWPGRRGCFTARYATRSFLFRSPISGSWMQRPRANQKLLTADYDFDSGNSVGGDNVLRARQWRARFALVA